jgi:thiol-disulfide isomerase/thioredoxin
MRAEEIAADGTAPEITGIIRWLNGEETSIALELAKGNVVLIDFWTYTCINCIRTLPFLTEWHDKYADRGLVIIGVHTPEFEFEKVPANIQAAIDQYGIQYRVPQDDDFLTWRAFNNRFWPAKYLIGPSMDVRYLHFGEGDYDETEVAIREALIDSGQDVSDIPFGTAAVEPVRDPDAGRQTRELYGGTRRNYRTPYAAQDEYYLQRDVEIFYEDIDTSREQRQHNMWYLQGLWRNEEEAIVHARNTTGLEDYLAFDFIARTVNVVLTVAEDGDPFDVFIEMDGRWLRPDEAGDHIRWDDQGRSFIRVTVNDLYRLVKLDQWSRHELKLRANPDQLQIFAFTFGSYVGGE